MDVQKVGRLRRFFGWCPRIPPGLTLGAFALAAVTLACIAPATATWRLSPPTAPEPYDARQNGSALTDVDLPVAAMAAWYIEATPELDLGHVLSASLRALTSTHVFVDVVSIHPAFEDAYPTARRAYPYHGARPRGRPDGGVGLTRLSLETAAADGRSDIVSHEILSAHGLLELDLSIRVSVGDTVMIVEDRALGFRRIYPLGVGAVDQIRLALAGRPGELSSITPTTRFGRLDKRESWEVMRFPKHFRDVPYIPLNIPRVVRTTRDDGEEEVRLVYRATWIAFHIWQQPRFARGYLSHGCVRMRDEDLHELAAFVYGVEETVPVVMVAEPLADARHSHWRLADRYYQLKNVGTSKKPKPWIVNRVWVTEFVGNSEVPPPEAIVGITIDSEALQELYDTELDPTFTGRGAATGRAATLTER